MISVLILTKNEERDLPGCLESVAWSDDVHVYDSYSTDATAAIAERAGARVWRRPGQAATALFGGDEAEHKNWALRNIPFRHEWVLHMDADERVSGELAASLRAAVAEPRGCVAFRLRRRDFFLGRALMHVQASPYYLRLFRPAKVHYERMINPVCAPDGPVGEAAGFLDHYPFSKGMAHWLERHNGYSTLEARQILANRAAGGRFSLRRALFARDFHERRFHQKELFYRLPGRPLLKFLLLYVVKRGFLDGRAGFAYAALQAFYEYMIVLKTRELAAGDTPEHAAAAAAGAPER
jgi:glycosyltransferase involved in cell wall biosynthesis